MAVALRREGGRGELRGGREMRERRRERERRERRKHIIIRVIKAQIESEAQKSKMIYQAVGIRMSHTHSREGFLLLQNGDTDV